MYLRNNALCLSAEGCQGLSLVWTTDGSVRLSPGQAGATCVWCPPGCLLFNGADALMRLMLMPGSCYGDIVD